MQRWNRCETVLNVNNVGGLGLKWVYKIGEGFTSPAVANGVVYVGSRNLYALNASTGALLWSYYTSDVWSSPAVANGVVYVGSWEYDGNLYALKTPAPAPSCGPTPQATWVPRPRWRTG